MSKPLAVDKSRAILPLYNPDLGPSGHIYVQYLHMYSTQVYGGNSDWGPRGM